MRNNHNCFKAKHVKLNISGDKTMLDRKGISRNTTEFETTFESVPKRVREDWENYKLFHKAKHAGLSSLPENVSGLNKCLI